MVCGGWQAGRDSNDAESLASLQLSVDLGCNFFDTAWAYGDGHSENLLGQIVRANPAKKLYTRHQNPPKEPHLAQPAQFHAGRLLPAGLYRGIHAQAAWRTPGMASIDLIQFHAWEDAWLEDDRWAKKMDELRSQGLVHAVGISINRWEPWNGVKAVRSGLIDAVQVIYNIFDQNPEDELFPACTEMDVAVIARVPFDEGTLTGSLPSTANGRKETGAIPTSCQKT